MFSLQSVPRAPEYTQTQTQTLAVAVAVWEISGYTFSSRSDAANTSLQHSIQQSVHTQHTRCYALAFGHFVIESVAFFSNLCGEKVSNG